MGGILMPDEIETEASDHLAMDAENELQSDMQRTLSNNIVKNHIIASLTLGLVPIPLFDLAALTATQMSMLRSLSEQYEIPFEDSEHKSLLASLIGGSLPVLGVVGLSSLTKFIPGVGSLIGSASLSISAGAVTYAVGQVFISHFESGGTFEDFEPKHASDYFKREFQAGKVFVSQMKDELKAAKEMKDELKAAQEVQDPADKPVSAS
jgi:uncharacterized protein (DUF697 family)